MSDSSNEPEIRGELAKKILAEKVRICTECETENSGLAKFCTDCGTSLARAEPKKKKRSAAAEAGIALLWIAGGVFVLLIIFVLWVFFALITSDVS